MQKSALHDGMSSTGLHLYVPAQIYQVYADQECPSAEQGRAKAERIAAYHGIAIDSACVPADQATFADGSVVPYCSAAQPEWSAYRCGPLCRDAAVLSLRKLYTVGQIFTTACVCARYKAH